MDSIYESTNLFRKMGGVFFSGFSGGTLERNTPLINELGLINTG